MQHVNSVDGELYQEGFGNGCYGVATNRDMNDSNMNLSDLNGKAIVTHSESLMSMRQCGLLSKYVIRQIHSDIVTVEALSRLQASEMMSN